MVDVFTDSMNRDDPLLSNTIDKLLLSLELRPSINRLAIIWLMTPWAHPPPTIPNIHGSFGHMTTIPLYVHTALIHVYLVNKMQSHPWGILIHRDEPIIPQNLPNILLRISSESRPTIPQN